MGRVAAGAIAELWLGREYGTRIVTFVSSVGTVELPAGLTYAPCNEEGVAIGAHPPTAASSSPARRGATEGGGECGGECSGGTGGGTGVDPASSPSTPVLPSCAYYRPWTRAEVDAIGTLRLLRDPATGWRGAGGAGGGAPRAAPEGAATDGGSLGAEAQPPPPPPAAASPPSSDEAGCGDAAGALPPPAAAEATPPPPPAAAATAAAAAVLEEALEAADEAAFLAVYAASSPDWAAQMTLGAAATAAAAASAGAAAGWSPPAGGPAGAAGGGAGGATAEPPAPCPLTAASEAGTVDRRRGFYARGTPAYEAHDGSLLDMHGEPAAPPPGWELAAARTTDLFALRCPHAPTAARMASLISSVKGARDSTGGVLTTVVSGVPVGLGEPVFDKAEALLAHAMLSLPATKGFEVGSGFRGTALRGSVHNDVFVAAPGGAAAAQRREGPATGGPAAGASSGGGGGGGGGPVLLATATNHAGGTLGGITSGADLVFRVAIKPVSTIGRAQVTATYSGEAAVLEARGRHDACVLPRAPPLVEAMAALVLADLALLQRARSGAPLHVLPPPPAPAGVQR